MADDLLNLQRHNASWADTFEGSSTNLAQRERYTRDKEEYAGAVVEQQQQQLLDRMTRDQTAQNLFFKTQELNLKKELHEDKLRKADELQPIKIRSEQALERQRTAQAERLLKEKALNAEIEADSHSFLAKRADLILANPNITDEQLEDHDMELSRSHPFAYRSPETKAIIDASRAGLTKRKQAKLDAEKATTKSSDAAQVRTEKSAEVDTRSRQTRIDNLKDQYAKSYANKDAAPEERTALLNRIKEIESEGAKEWLDKNPTDPRAAKIREKLGIK